MMLDFVADVSAPVHPSPLRGGTEGGGSALSTRIGTWNSHWNARTPTPNPSPHGGGGRKRAIQNIEVIK